MRARSPLSAAALLLAVLAAGAAPVLAQDSGSGGGQGGQGASGGAGGGTAGGDTGTGASGSSGTTGDLGTNQGRPSTSDVEDPGGGTSGAMPDAGAGAEGAAGPIVALPRERVRQMQERLAAAGFDPGPADGTVGPQTRAALRAFQEERGLAPTGEPNGATLIELGFE
jgi:peptidoglycan hydrolase-like protein with peptidoglycan-binding domain